MKNLFKKGMASVLATAIAMSSMIISASAELAISGEKSVEAGKTLSLTVTGKTGNLTVASSDAKVATATISDTTVTVTGVAGGTAKIAVTDSGAKADDKTDDVTKEYEITVTPGTFKVYIDSEKKTESADEKGKIVSAYINGGKVNGVDKKSALLYPDVTAKGKLAVALSTKKDAAPAVTNGKIAADSAANEIAKASIKNGVVTVTAGKKEGTVYAYVYDIKDGKVVAQSAAAPVLVNTASNIISVYDPKDIGEDDKPVKDAKALKTGTVNSNGSAEFAIYGSVKTGVDTINAFTVSVPDKFKTLITLDGADDKGVLTIEGNDTFTVNAGALKADTKNSLKVKTASAQVDITNTLSGKKTSLKLVIVNTATGVKTNAIKTGYATIIDEKGDVSKVDVAFNLGDSTIATTDKVTTTVLGEQAKFDATKGKLTVKASKNYAAKLQQTDKGTFRARITAKANIDDKATETAYVYVITTDAAKNVTYYEVATISAKTGEIKPIEKPVVYVNGVKQVVAEA